MWILGNIWKTDHPKTHLPDSRQHKCRDSKSSIKIIEVRGNHRGEMILVHTDSLFSLKFDRSCLSSLKTWQSNILYMTLDHKTSHKGQFFETEIYTSPESWINKLSIDVWLVRIGQYLAEIQLLGETYKYLAEIQLTENLESEGAKKSKYWENRL